jgi:hypothetical protein
VLLVLFITGCNNKYVGYWCKYNETATIVVLLNDDITEEQRNNIEETAKNYENISGTNYYSKEDVLNMEKDILLTLPYNLLSPSPIKFYEYLSLILGLDKKAYFLGKFLMESFLYDLNYIKFRPSIISCTCAYIAMKIFKKDNYKESYKKQWYKIEGEEGYEIEIGCNIKDCAKKICKFLKVILKGKSLYCYKKYSTDNCFYASNIIVNVYIKKKNNPIDDAHL